MSDFINFDEALELKHLGFNEHVFCTYRKGKEFTFEDDGPNRNSDIDTWASGNGICSAPLYSQVFRWFREEHNLASYIEATELAYEDGYVYTYQIPKLGIGIDEYVENYEEAELKCLKELIKILKNK
jgi:hypothetical protein